MDSQKTPKEVGTCSVCWSTFRIQRATGQIHKHGPRCNPCPGSDKPPSTVQPPQSRSSSQHSPVATSSACTVANTQSLQTSQPVTGRPANDVLSHPKWITLISRIPRAARPACRELLTEILRRIVAEPNNKSAWRELLSFGPAILAKPKRGGVNRNLSNVINRRVATWDRQPVPADSAQQTRNVGGHKKND